MSDKISLINREARVLLTTGGTAGVVRAESARAILVDMYGIEIWLPKSQIEIDEYGEIVEIDIPEWLARKIEQELGEVG